MKHRMSDLVTAAFLLDHGHMVVHSDFGQHNHHHHYNHLYHTSSKINPTFNSVHHWLPGQNTAEWQVRGLLESDLEKPQTISGVLSSLAPGCQLLLPRSLSCWDIAIMIVGMFWEEVSGKVMHGGHVSYEIHTFIVRWSISKYHWMHELGLLARFSGRDTIRSK